MYSYFCTERNSTKTPDLMNKERNLISQNTKRAIPSATAVLAEYDSRRLAAELINLARPKWPARRHLTEQMPVVPSTKIELAADRERLCAGVHFSRSPTDKFVRRYVIVGTCIRICHNDVGFL
ncbi:hypothetical protein WA026_003940 [Henosepilachna vigintioctopunctata]|uniref:Uncharacterized protein n=1 Tax=Henosepilachna vigintioctopunctata TaxID=420089 RepID=A0AAW1U965_9CUCU